MIKKKYWAVWKKKKKKLNSRQKNKIIGIIFTI